MYSDPHITNANQTYFRSGISLATFVFVAVLSFLIYYITAFRTITWWDSAEYSTAAATLGIPHPPGSLVTVILGWIVTKLPIAGGPAFKLNVFAGIIAAISIGMILIISIFLFKMRPLSNLPGYHRSVSTWIVAGIGLGVLIFAFSETFWLYAVKFTPYIFTPFMTAMILLAMLKWWQSAEEKDSYRWLFIVLLLFGLDFSVHRTNLLMLPGLLLWIILRYPKTFISIKSWLAGIGGLFLGLCLQLLMIPMALRQPYLNFNDPRNLMKLWDYMSLKQYGGAWLLNLFPRKAPFWEYQIRDYLDGFSVNFISGPDTWSPAGILILILGLTGFIFLWKRNWRLAAGLTVMFLFAGLGAVIYFNIPENFFRPFNRHYLPSLVIFAIWIAYGAGSIFGLIPKLKKTNRTLASLLMVVSILLLAAIGLGQISRNHLKCNGSDRFFAEDLGRNILNTLPDNSILICGSDIDSHSLWYLQGARDLRPDLAILNISLMNTPWHINNLIHKEPAFPLGLTSEEINKLNPQIWRDSVVSLKLEANTDMLGLPDSLIIPDSVDFYIAPNLAGKALMVQDQIMLSIIKENQWVRPIYFTSFASGRAFPWLKPYLYTEGIAHRLIPISGLSVDKDILEKNLLQKYTYRGFSDTTIYIEKETKWAAWELYGAFIALAESAMRDGNTSVCLRIKEKMTERLPIDRLTPHDALMKAIDAICIPAKKERQER